MKKKADHFHECELFASELNVGMICRGHLFDNGVIMRAVGDRLIIAPPLMITRDELDEVISVIWRCRMPIWLICDNAV